MSTTHELKTWPEFFRAMGNGSKTFELRRDDRSFAVGDKLVLFEFDPRVNLYTDRKLYARISYVLRDAPSFGLAPGFAILGLVDVRHAPRCGNDGCACEVEPESSPHGLGARAFGCVVVVVLALLVAAREFVAAWSATQ